MPVWQVQCCQSLFSRSSPWYPKGIPFSALFSMLGYSCELHSRQVQPTRVQSAEKPWRSAFESCEEWRLLWFFHVRVSNLLFPQMKLASEKPPEAVLERGIFLGEHAPRLSCAKHATSHPLWQFGWTGFFLLPMTLSSHCFQALPNLYCMSFVHSIHKLWGEVGDEDRHKYYWSNRAPHTRVDYCMQLSIIWCMNQQLEYNACRSCFQLQFKNVR